MAERKAYPEFQELLRKGIGTRTQKDFAEETGITKESINRMLNNELIPQPSKTTLRKIANHVSIVSYSEFLASCGYDKVSVEEDIKETENGFMEAVNALKTGIYQNVSDFLESIDMLFMDKGTFSKISKRKEVEDISSVADYSVQGSYSWDSDCNKCILDFTVYFAETQKGKIVVTNVTFNDPAESFFVTSGRAKTIEHAIVIENPKRSTYVSGAKPDDFISRLFLEDYYVSETYIGFGIQYEGIPDNFKEFLLAHASSYCTSKKKKKIFKGITESDNLEETFEELEDDEQCPLCPGDIIADILSKETGKDFEFFYHTSPQGGADTVMIKCNSCHEINQTPLAIINAVYNVAKELNIPEFGTCYHEMRESKAGTQYITKDFHIEF